MIGTLNMLKGVIQGKEFTEEENTLISKYQNTLDSTILALMFVKNFGMLYELSNSAKNLNEQDKASFCLQELDKCLRNFDINNKAKFSTYLFKCYKNRLRTEIENQNTQKRRIQYYCDSTDELNNISINYFEDDEINISEKYNLDEIEEKSCKLLIDGYKIKEIAKKVNLSTSGMYARLTRIRTKILSQI